MLAVGVAIVIPITSAFLISGWLFGSRGQGYHYPEPWRCIFAVLAPFILAGYGLKKKSLSPSGAVAGMIVGFCITLSSMCFFVSLFTFFIAGSKATKYKGHLKRKLEDNFKEGGQRDWRQVLCNGGVATWLSITYMMEIGCVDLPINFSRHYNPSWLGMAILGSLACCCGDTFASEFGSVLGSQDPWLITSFRVVPRGTNGAVSRLGIAASAVGGLLVSLGYFAAVYVFTEDIPTNKPPPQWPLLIVGLFAGLAGSLVDSILGSLFQFSGLDVKQGKIVEMPGPSVEHICGLPLLDNNTVNLLSALITALLTPYIAHTFIWPLCM